MKSATAMTLVYLSILSLMVGGLLLSPMATATTIQADVDFDPDKINLMSGPDGWTSPDIIAFIRFPRPYKKDVIDINVSTILLEHFIPVTKSDLTKTVCKTFFDRQVVQDHLWLKTAHMGYNPPFKNKKVDMIVTGNLNDGTPFEGTATVIVSAK